MTTSFSFCRLAVIGVLAASFALTACGRRGPLDPPPRAQAQPGEQQQQQQQQGATEDAFGNPIVPTGPKKKFFLDFLLN